MSGDNANKENIPPPMEMSDDNSNKENIPPPMEVTEVEVRRDVNHAEWFELGGDWMFVQRAIQLLLLTERLRGPTREALEAHLITLEEMKENILRELLGREDLEPLVVELSAIYDDYIDIERRAAEEQLLLFPTRRED